MAQQPDFGALTTALGALTNALATIGTEVALVPNMPAIDIGNQIAQLQQQQQQQFTVLQQQFAVLQQQQQQQFVVLQQQQQLLDGRLQQQMQQQISRQANAWISAENQGIEKLVDLAGNVPPGFPVNTEALRAMRGPAINGLLQAYGQQTNGTIAIRRRRLVFFLGLAHQF